MPIPRELNAAQFSEHLEAIRILYVADDDFRSLCDDYSTVKTDIEKFKGNSVKDLQRELEYKHLSIELEKEILYYVKNKRR